LAKAIGIFLCDLRSNPFIQFYNVMKIFVSLTILLVATQHSQALDANANGMSDVFEQLYGVTNPLLDPDGDGLNNLAESLAGTQPLNSSSYFRAAYSFAPQPGSWLLTWTSVIGKNYGMRISADLLATNWLTVPGPSILGTGGTLTLASSYSFPFPVNKTFYQVFTRSSDDMDGDGLDAWEESLLNTSDFLLDDDGDLIPTVLEVINSTNPLSSTSPANSATFLTLGSEPDTFEVFPPGNSP
jgi:hypothetical protein